MHAGVARLRQMGRADVTLSSFQFPATCGSRAGTVRPVCESGPSVLLPIWVCVEAVRKTRQDPKGEVQLQCAPTNSYCLYRHLALVDIRLSFFYRAQLSIKTFHLVFLRTG